MEKVAIYVRESNHSNAQDAIRRQEQKVSDFCKAKGYSVCDSATIIGDRKEGFPVLMDLLRTAKSKGVEKIVMASTNRVVGKVDEVAAVNEAFEASEIMLETIDGSHEALRTPDFITRTFAAFSEEDCEDN